MVLIFYLGGPLVSLEYDHPSGSQVWGVRVFTTNKVVLFLSPVDSTTYFRVICNLPIISFDICRCYLNTSQVFLLLPTNVAE